LLLPGSFAHHGIVDASGLEEGQIGSFASVKIEEKLVAMKWKRPSGLSGCLQRSCFILKLLLIFVGIFNPLFLSAYAEDFGLCPWGSIERYPVAQWRSRSGAGAWM